MRLTFNPRHLAKKNLSLRGELTAAELEIAEDDELIHVPNPLKYDLTVQAVEGAALVQGRLEVLLVCECARCLRPFEYQVVLPDWVCLVPLSGQGRAPAHNDSVDLTPFVREDTLLAFPQRPLCDVGCPGLAPAPPGRPAALANAQQAQAGVSVWAELNKLKF
jgi:uncharacterized protein